MPENPKQKEGIESGRDVENPKQKEGIESEHDVGEPEIKEGIERVQRRKYKAMP